MCEMKILSVIYAAEGGKVGVVFVAATLTVGFNVYYPCKNQGVALKGSPDGLM